MTLVFHSIKDPVHGSMQFTQEENNWIKPFIDTENFQRMRYISQLGLTDWIFPGAVHTRFSHSLGACYIACEIANKFALPPQDKRRVMLACLLHDIGHGPFSHSFESVFYKSSIKHEMWTAGFIEEYKNTDFLVRFNSKNFAMPLTEEDLNIIENLISHGSNANKLLGDIVSSQLDADRLDYLLRDSHFCGVAYGRYGFRWLLHCLTVVEKDGEQRLGVIKKGIGAVEHYLSARRLMFRNIYQHGKKHGSEFYLQEFLRQLAKALVEEKLFSSKLSNFLTQFLQQLYRFNNAAKTTQNLLALSNDFVAANYHLYKRLCNYDVIALIRELATWDIKHTVICLAKRLHNRKLPKVWQLNEHKMILAEKIFNEWCDQFVAQFEPWQVSISYLPSVSYEKRNDPILLADKHFSEATYLHDDSFVIDALLGKSENVALLIIDSAIIAHKDIQSLYLLLQTNDVLG